MRAETGERYVGGVLASTDAAEQLRLSQNGSGRIQQVCDTVTMNSSIQ